jgi:hypothetical protein
MGGQIAVPNCAKFSGVRGSGTSLTDGLEVRMGAMMEGFAVAQVLGERYPGPANPGLPPVAVPKKRRGRIEEVIGTAGDLVGALR